MYLNIEHFHSFLLALIDVNLLSFVFIIAHSCSFVQLYRQLLQAYFRDFTFEKLEKPWRAFTGSWSKAAIARHLGINSSFTTGDHCYVLVRVARFRDTQRLAGTAETLALDDTVLRQTENVTVGDTASVVRFIRNFGSHYIASYITGNSLYQVSSLD